VLETIEQIRGIDPAFPDPQELADKALEELEKAEAEKRRRIELEAGYNEAAALLESGQYQQALEAWQAVQQIDPAYPDARKIEATASKKLGDLSKPSERRSPSSWASSNGALSGLPGSAAARRWRGHI